MNSLSPAGARRLHIAVAILLALLILGNMALIYFFSSESGEASGDRSAGVTDAVIGVFCPDYAELSPDEREAVTVRVHHLVRKTAHLLEYALLGFLTACFTMHLRRWFWVRIPRWGAWVFPVVFCLLYAISDEVHQIFSARGPRVTDVLIDLAGAVCGVGAAHGAGWLWGRISAARSRRKTGKEGRVS